jgi:hypothetical protein
VIFRCLAVNGGRRVTSGTQVRIEPIEQVLVEVRKPINVVDNQQLLKMLYEGGCRRPRAAQPAHQPYGIIEVCRVGG